ncbi:hypothetical protein HAX54_018799 [Datura stramonium]|uniref:Uncharacterized protein n=1 Tax=Datura stramonium TaxID=4076 RepID=A0ABS8UQA1_DATST|nr:hypothetical protein [Datura stramonium]
MQLSSGTQMTILETPVSCSYEAVNSAHKKSPTLEPVKCRYSLAIASLASVELSDSYLKAIHAGKRPGKRSGQKPVEPSRKEPGQSPSAMAACHGGGASALAL